MEEERISNEGIGANAEYEEIEISADLYEQLSARATREGQSEEEIVVAALRWYLDHLEARPGDSA